MKPKCPDVFTVEFARELVTYLGGDASLIATGDWWELGKKFPHLRRKVEKYFAEATTGDPAWAAYYMVRYCGSTPEWGK